MSWAATDVVVVSVYIFVIHLHFYASNIDGTLIMTIV